MKLLNSKPFFIFLFPLLFYVIEYTNFCNYINFNKLIIPIIIFTSVVLIIYQFIIKHKNKQNELLLFYFLLFFTYFGNIKESLRNSSFAKISSYPIYILLIIILFYILKKLLTSNNKLAQTIYQYCNYLVYILISIQVFLIATNIKNFKVVEPLSFNKNIKVQNKPNVYFILFDKYGGSKNLNFFFKYDNSYCYNQLKQKGFTTIDSINSNYNITVASMSSMLNMQYLNAKELVPYNNYSFYLKTFVAINNNQVVNNFNDLNYQFNNLSIFDVDNNTSNYNYIKLPTSLKIIHKNIFPLKLFYDLSWIFTVGKLKTKAICDYKLLKPFLNNIEQIDKTIAIAKSKNANPSFTYTHLLLPHEPYYTDSLGNLYPDSLRFTNNDFRYLYYLQYATTRMLQLADTLIKYDSHSIIIFASDHGFSNLDTMKEIDYPIINNNFLAVRFPDSNYSEISKLKSNANLFRVIFNQYYQQNYPILKDSFYNINNNKNNIETIKPF